MKRIVVAIGVVLAACGGPRQPSAQPGQIYFWKVTSSAVEFGTCSDEKQFRDDLAPLKFEANSFLIYKVSQDAKSAVTQTCSRVDPSTCAPSTTNVVFQVAVPELVFTTEGKTPLGMAGCNLKDASTWTLTDKGSTGTLDIVHVLTEVDNPAACMAAETQLKAQAPNMTGLEGCVVTFKVGLSLQQ